MAVSRRRDLIASRRRKADEGEEDEVESLDYESQSEGSLLSGANDSLEDEVSEGSRSRQNGDGGGQKLTGGSVGKKLVDNGLKLAPANASTLNPPTHSATVFAHTADTDAMANGLKPPADVVLDDVLQFDESSQSAPKHVNGNLPEKFAHFSRRENQRGAIHRTKDSRLGVKQNGSMSLDSARNSRKKARESSSFGLAFNVSQDGPSSTTDRWNHDLHELLEGDKHDAPIVEDIPRRNLPAYTTSAKGPEPLSRTVTIGHITLRVSLRGMSSPITYDKMPLKYHIRLPDLRPPLRRDKPVRVAIPLHTPRYIFPSVDRSFIFIPRAQRPNQQTSRKAFGSRRNSVLGGSSYTPSVAMSRRSSIAREGIMSPAASAISKPPLGAPIGPSRPIVKLPSGVRAQAPVLNGAIHTGPTLPPTDGVSEPMHPPPGKPTFQSQWTGQLPVHQPRPQKTVSVTTIESPSKDKMFTPHQHDHQPFHHQVPNHVNGVKSMQEYAGAYHSHGPASFHNTQPGGTPSHLPENAINAQPFQPDQPQIYYPAPYHMQEMMVYPSADNQNTQYGSQHMMGPPVYMQPAPHGSYLVPMLSATGMPPIQSVADAPLGTTAYESNGTVYFYDATPYGEGAVNNASFASPGHDGTVKSGEEVFYPQPPLDYYPPQ